MTWRRNAYLSLLAAAGLAGACGDELPQHEVNGASRDIPACELVTPGDLQQIFVNELVLDEASRANDACTWIDVASGEAFLHYQLHPYTADLQALARGPRGDAGAEPVRGLGEAAFWTERGLFVNRNGRTLQITPLAADGDRAPYQELARLLLTRLEAG